MSFAGTERPPAIILLRLRRRAPSGPPIGRRTVLKCRSPMHPMRTVLAVVIGSTLITGPLCGTAMADHASFRHLTIGITAVQGKNPAVANAIYDAFRNKVIAMQRFTVLERDDARMKQVIKEAAFGASGLVDKASAPKIGQLLGAGYLTFLEYSNFTVDYEEPKKEGESGTYNCAVTVTARFVNTETGVALHAFTTTGSGSDKERSGAVTEAIETVVANMLLSTREVFALRGAILSRDGREIITDLGSGHGLSDDTYFTVVRETQGLRKKIGLVRLDTIGEAKSEGTIREGFWNVRVGDQLEENPRYSRPMGISPFYEFVSMAATTGGSTTAGFPAFGAGNLFGAAIKAPELFSDAMGLSLGAGYLMPGGRGVSGILTDLTGTFRWDLVPDWFAVDVRLGPTLGFLFQDRANFQLPALASQSTDAPSGMGVGAAAGVNGVLLLGRSFRLFAGVGYRYVSAVNSWSAGSSTAKTEYTVSDPNAIAYPSVGISGLTFQGGLDGQF